ncbi:MAG: DUF1854 domain-containing protein [Verrucomicrobiota bacterium]
MITLSRRGDAIFAETETLDEPVEVKLVYARPVSDRSGSVSVIQSKGKEELAWIDSIADLDDASRSIAEAALLERYQVNQINAIDHSFVNHGHRYLRVQTQRGERYFNLKEPGKNVTWLSDDHVVIRDSMGNRYEVPSIASLSQDSRERLERVL